jgi:hypothetical protein
VNIHDLVEVPTKVLAEELQRRYDVFFAVGMRDRLPGEDLTDSQMESEFMHGEQLRLIGVIERAKFRLMMQIYEDSTIDDDGDDDV